MAAGYKQLGTWQLGTLLAAGYKLPLDNDKAPFYWTSTVQIISKVYLKKHLRQSRTYTLNKKDTKMVQSTMGKKLTA